MYLCNYYLTVLVKLTDFCVQVTALIIIGKFMGRFQVSYTIDEEETMPTY